MANNTITTSKKTKHVDPETKALRACIRAITTLPDNDRGRLVRYLLERYGAYAGSPEAGV